MENETILQLIKDLTDVCSKYGFSMLAPKIEIKKEVISTWANPTSAFTGPVFSPTACSSGREVTTTRKTTDVIIKARKIKDTYY